MSDKVNVELRTKKKLLEELELLSARHEECEQTLNAILSGDVDAMVVSGPHGDQVYSLSNADRTYRLIVETMNEAALTVSLNETVLFCNQRFCELVKSPLSSIVAKNFSTFFPPAQIQSMRKFLADAQAGPVKRRITLLTATGAAVSVQISASLFVSDDLASICLVATDLTELESQTNSILVMREQQQALEESQIKLQAANILLIDSRRAALNMMEDSVEARSKIEISSTELKHEIVERKRAEKELQASHDELESRVEVRTKELTTANEQLMQEINERKRAEESLQGALTEIRQLKDRLRAENIHLQQEVAQEYNFGEIIGQSASISQVFYRVEQVAPQDTTVLLLGETGTGKGVVARALHSKSARNDRPMITVNCTALPANLIESELFGREKGAFTGAHARQIGRFELANGGTIFLDEIGEMPMELQCKLLRVIQDGEFERLGSPRTVKVDVRIIAATNRNLEEEIRNGRFREDLFYRLSVFPISIPPLRQRKEDIPLLVNHFVAKFNKKIGKKIELISKETLGILKEFQWPGNVRELESVIERAVITSQGSSLEVLDRFASVQKTEESIGQEVKDLAELESNYIYQVLQKTGWRIEGAKGAALLLGINPSTLRARMRRFGIIRL